MELVNCSSVDNIAPISKTLSVFTSNEPVIFTVEKLSTTTSVVDIVGAIEASYSISKSDFEGVSSSSHATIKEASKREVIDKNKYFFINLLFYH